MRVPPDLAALFVPSVRERGEAYHRQGRVRRVASEAGHFAAVVRGTQPYHVTLDAGRSGTVAMSCTCPHAEEGAACKHMWATILTALAERHPMVVYATRAPDDEEDDLGGEATVPAPVVAAVQRPPRRLAPHELAREAAREMSRRAMSEEPASSRWREALERLRREESYRSPWDERTAPAHPPVVAFPANRRLAYVVDLDAAREHDGGVVVELATQATRGSGRRMNGWAPPRRFAYSRAEWLAVPDAEDREIAQMLLGARELREEEHPFDAPLPLPREERRFRIAPAAYHVTLRRICATGRAFGRRAVRAGEVEHGVLRWDDGPAWRLEVALAAFGEHRVRVAATLVRERGGTVTHVPLAEAAMVADGLVVLPDESAAPGEGGGGLVAATMDDLGAMPLVRALREGRPIVARTREAEGLAQELERMYPRLGPVLLPAGMGVEVVRVAPVPVLALRGVDAELSFAYDDAIVGADVPGSVVSQRERQRAIARDLPAERAAVARLEQAGARREYDDRRGGTVHRLPRARVERAALELVAEGWRVTLDAQAVRMAGETLVSVRSGVDWFDLEAEVDFAGLSVGLPALLEAMRGGVRSVTLPDGSLGLLPDEWMARHGALALAGAESANGVRFGRGQAALLDALLAALPASRADAAFERAREVLRRFEGFRPAEAPEGFGATLRPYQEEGLGWLLALHELGLGGVLADDMGLGKTVQVLALLEHRRRAGAGASLVVVPASIVFNWVQEAARFAPGLRVRVHHGAGRSEAGEAVDGADLVITTYGTLRRDAAEFRDVEWEYVVLDEAQAIKNASTATAKAARLLHARHRLAMSGTPVENRIEELWSLFEFLNPGMLGASTAFRRLTSGEAAVDVLARAVRPYILRRTKAQVARDLPERVEQTVWVELGETERRLYDELRAHYRASLLGRVDAEGLGPSRMHVLEALLRLRQAACHPGLIDPARAGDPSAKLDVLLARVAETVDEGHKVLVFSQFTSMLALVRARLDAEGTAYEYLDGRTRDRQARVERFQGDESVRVFLVSLKAGGVGLNLTAADYVFLMDPWWNPAVEAQAIDRAHRIGQTRHVIATRLVARDTVEEKVLQLQAGKRALADAIVRADEGGMLRALTRDDLEMLLG